MTGMNAYVHIHLSIPVTPQQEQVIGGIYASHCEIPQKSIDKYAVRRNKSGSQWIIEARWDVDKLINTGLRNLANQIEQTFGLPVDFLWNNSQITFLGTGLDKDTFEANIYDVLGSVEDIHSLSKEEAILFMQDNAEDWLYTQDDL